ncbi:P-loop containing nucleoside triphosphate hydrolase protein [Syncephalis plumigaleata]|nr:P-loop containing nucleoside triphosphate hydrolase protein [Syncephalis plumigaleata]
MTRLSNIDGIAADVLTTLNTAGIHTVQDVLVIDEKTLCNKTKLSVSTVEHLYELLLDSLNVSMDNAAMLATSTANTICASRRLSTGCTSIDRLLGGGLLPGHIVELFGLAGSGKTQIAHNVVAQGIIALHTMEQNNVNHSALLRTLLASQWTKHEDCNAALKRVSIFSCNTIYEVFDTFEQLGIFSHSNKSPYLLVIDSVSAVLSPLLSNHSRQGHALMLELAYTLSDIAHRHSSRILILNTAVRQVPEDEDNGNNQEGAMATSTQTTSSAPLFKPALGASWQYTPHTRIYMHAILSRSPDPFVIARLFDLSSRELFKFDSSS